MVPNGRLVCLDWGRGMSILLVLFFHALIFNNDAPLPPPDRMPGFVAVLNYFVAWAGVFATISGISNALSLYGPLSCGTIDRRRMIRGALGGGLAIIALNYAYLAFFSPGFLELGKVPPIGILPALVRTGGFGPPSADHLLFCTALMMVGWGKVATGVSIWTLTRDDRPRVGTSGRIALGIAATAIVCAYPLVKAILRPLFVLPVTPWALPLDLVLTWIVGPMDPIVPYVGFTLYGVLFGLLIVDRAPRWHILAYGYTTGALWTIAAAFSYHATGYYNNPWDIPDFGPLIQILGPMILTCTAVMHAMDLGSERRRRFFWRWTRTVRLFGILSLTAFLLEGTVSALLRRLVELAKPGFTNDVEFLFAIFSPFVVLCWFAALKLWARVNFAGSFEWLLVQASNRLTGKVSRRLDAAILLNSAEAYFGKHAPTDEA